MLIRDFSMNNKIKGDGVAERIKASVATHTGAGSNPAVGGIFLRASYGVQREVPPSPPGIWQIPSGAH